MASYVKKSPIDLSDELIRQARKDTLNKRINYKGNYENYINGNSHAINNQAGLRDTNATAVTMKYADPKGIGADWTLPGIKEYTDRIQNRYGNENGYRLTPATKKERRLSDIYWEKVKNRSAKTPDELFGIEK